MWDNTLLNEVPVADPADAIRGDAERTPEPYGTHMPSVSRMPKTVHWAIPWSDLMMTMFIFFAMLYFFQANSSQLFNGEGEKTAFGPSSQSSVNVKAGTSHSIPAKMNDSLSALYDLSKETVAKKDLKDVASVDLVPDKAVRIILAGDLLFDIGEAEIKPEASMSLRQVADIIRTSPYMVNVVGHTDDVPIRSSTFPSNWELSVIRASKVARFLIEEMNIPGNRIFVTGHAYYQPIRPNSSEENRAFNRRVEIIITKERPRASREKDAFITDYRFSGNRISWDGDRWPWNTF